MKRVIKRTILPLVVLLTLASCGSGSFAGSKSKDIPDYALGKSSYFASREGNGATAFLGFADGRTGFNKYGLLDNGRNLSGDMAIIDGKNMILLYASSHSYGKYLIEEDSAHIMHILWNKENPENSYNLSLASGSTIRSTSYNKIESNYSDSYLFANRKKLAEAVAYIESLEKQPNQPSQYNAEEHGGTKTYKARIGKQVEYFGNDSLEVKRFQSLYLDCGAVVECNYKGWNSDLVGKTIDCVTDDNNKVVIYEIIKE